LRKQFPHVDFFIPPHNSEKLAEYLHLSLDIGHWSLLKQGQPGTSFVSIMTGCDNFCSYCVVPYVRGRETSRPPGEVLAEIKGLLEQGVNDITLLGQNVNSYKYGFASLLRKIGELFSLPVTRYSLHFMTSHPKDLSDELIETVAALPYVAKDFHLPLQSGDDEILKKMNRGYTVEYFKGRVAKVRSLLPKARISTDLMVGFPGETDEQFGNSLKTFGEIGFTMANMFAYSPRPRTAAAAMPGQVPEVVKQARLKRLIEVNREVLGNRNA
jgi:tRNA-2-methylthio-N6-dimethylallyladenosine synthase